MLARPDYGGRWKTKPLGNLTGKRAMANISETASGPKFQIFRAREGLPYAEAEVMHAEAFPPVAAENWPKLSAAGFEAGSEVTLLFSVPGMSLTYVWFKSGLPLPRHSHSADCLYYIIAGSLDIGAETLQGGDGFFIGADVPYAYTPGEQGVELLEFRTSNSFDIRFLAENPAFWSKGVAEVQRRQAAWASEGRPTASRASE